ncbi:MAG TPA: STAS domain-containing protein [Acidimicrobiia bacterium]
MFLQVSLVGEIDLTNADAHGELLDRVLDLGAGDTLLVDCRDLAFLELRGMAMMQRVHRHGIARGTDVHWVGLSAAHRRLLELAGLDGKLSLRDVPIGDAARDVQVNDACSSASQNRTKPSWSSPI